MSNPFHKIKIVKLFASSEYKTRNKAYKVITKLLKFDFGNEKRQINEKDIIGIWKGLYMWLWMQDKPILHEEVVGKICNLLLEISSEKVAKEFIIAFFITMMREWKKIDFHRLDKFYMLTRDFFSSCLLWVQTKDMDEWFITMIGKDVLNGIVDQGIEFKLHLIDILLDELIKTNSSIKLSTDILITCIKSMGLLNQKNAYLQRMKKRVVQPLFEDNIASKINVNMYEIGNAVSKREGTEIIHKKTDRMLVNFANQFLRCKKSEDVEEKAVSMVTEESNNVDAALEDNEASMETSLEDNEASMETPLEDNVAPIETALTDNVAPVETASEDNEASVETAFEDNEASVETALESAKDRRVSFGKKYIKKFKKSDVNLRMSLGTVKNTKMRSILKKR